MAELFRAHALRHTFPNQGIGLDNINISITEKEYLIIAGRNGAGKSLLMRHFIGLSKPDSGEIWYRGAPIQKQLALIRKEVGYVFQDTEAQIFGQTVGEDIAFGPANLGVRGEALEHAAAAALEKAHLEGMEDRRPSTLSGGEKRRLALAGVLAMKPRCVILDEPFANLDFPSIREILEVLAGLRAEGVTLVVLTHEIEKVFAFATRMVILDKGRITFDAPPADARREDFESSGLVCPYRAWYPWLID